MEKIVKRGQPTKLLKAGVKEKILKYIEQGNYISTACRAVGITYSTFNNWQNWAEEYANNPSNGNSNKKKYFDFFEELKRAEAVDEVDTIASLKEVGKKPQYWMTNAWRMERKYKDKWGKQEQPQENSKVLVLLQNSFASLKDVAKQSFDDVKQIPQEGVTEERDEA